MDVRSVIEELRRTAAPRREAEKDLIAARRALRDALHSASDALLADPNGGHWEERVALNDAAWHVAQLDSCLATVIESTREREHAATQHATLYGATKAEIARATGKRHSRQNTSNSRRSPTATLTL